ncbi:NADH:ubiquinone oxidoreductase [Yoonia sediminilitoris]|uniref:Putative flap endonuclease-1-like 5' DNA nuclease n=1 Tax=Yoonia sediminilitoris TaxID=1286148 RepID=A0A2T6KRA9_9RHOB|nr:NADH:ubiquinone oxidoreductase [Yoonia sediminilitoris]PUB19075.1 putative flap endonuclease-1-like 5' DNA nuclease [Yoonia sediminilitoris]RCW99243.1 putative flap endonuclease-1-like 5' DNA nuclease [Yoonia sediminilitoris]
MKDTAPKGQGIIAVSALFGVIAAGVAFVLFSFGGLAAIAIGAVVAAIAAIYLLLGWREPAPYTGPATAPSATAPSVESAPTAEAAAPAPAAPQAAPAAAPAAKTEEPVVKPTATLAGEQELAAKKGDWKYEGDKAEAPAPSADAAAPTFLKEAREGGPDDLKQIKGVGPKLEKTLHEMGIFHFDQISGWGPAEQAWMDDNLEGFKGRATRDNWVEQAKTLAAGGETDFSKKVEKGGVY